MPKVLILLFVLSTAANAQEQKDSFIEGTSAIPLSLAQPEWQVSRDTFLSPQSIQILYGDRVDILLRPDAILSESRRRILETKTDASTFLETDSIIFNRSLESQRGTGCCLIC